MSAPSDVLVCPITGERLRDPVVDPEGNTYERSAILDWLSRNATSPLTRNPLRIDQLVPNRALAELLAATVGTQGINISAPAGAGTEVVNPIRRFEPKAEEVVQDVDAPPYEVKLQVHHDGQGTVAVQLEAASMSTDDQHSSCTVVCVIDISYSMDNSAKMHGDMEGSLGLSLLDIVKHATRTVIETMQPHDRLGIVAFANMGKIVFPIKQMTRANKDAAWAAVDRLRTDGQTNVWDGLLKALDMVKAAGVPKANIMLLTDGMPNVEPPRGHIPSLRQYKEVNPNVNAEISTFGFGYNLDSMLLHNLAVEGSGSYAFIPDASFVGTCFVNATANILATAIPMGSTLLIEPINGYQVVGPLSEVRYAKTADTPACLRIDLPAIQYGQKKTILLRVEPNTPGDNSGSLDPASFSVMLSPLKAKLLNSDGGSQTVAAEAVLAKPGTPEALNIQVEQARLLIVQLIRDSERTWSTTKERSEVVVLKNIEELKRDLAACLALPGIDKPHMQALLDDLSGQITEAYSRQDWHDRWGRHYLLSLARAHTLQQCTNFKDPGLQLYAEPKFSAIRDRAEETFVKLPPPTPSLMASTHIQPVSMSRYHDSSNPCFATGQVRMADGSTKDVAEVVAGDIVATLGGSAPVQCVVETACAGGYADLVTLPGGVVVTRYHPVRPSGSAAGAKGPAAWSFPCSLAPSAMLPCTSVYSFVLNPPTAGAMMIGDYECATLGHEVPGDVIGHPYLGTGRVVEDLKRMRGWAAGRVVLMPGPAERDPSTGLIVRLHQDTHRRVQEADCRSYLISEMTPFGASVAHALPNGTV